MKQSVMAPKTWQEIAQDMQKHRANTIIAVEPAVPDPPPDLPLNVTGMPKQLLSDEVLSITERLPEDLILELANNTLSALAVTNAFLQRAGLASKLVNCCTELLPERALTRAKFLDDYMVKHKKPIGPLHGLPISVKEHIGMKGLDLNAGFVSWVGNTSPDDAIILKLLWNAGCVFYARTTQPQTLMHLETSNNIYGKQIDGQKAYPLSGHYKSLRSVDCSEDSRHILELRQASQLRGEQLQVPSSPWLSDIANPFAFSLQELP